jgi:hypothetical protein
MGKVFTAILNRRLCIISEEYNILNKNQWGFRSGHSTCDNIFILHSLIWLYLGCGKKYFCCFVDFSKAFDTVWKADLWQQLLDTCIDGKCFRIIRNMYSKIKSCITQGNEFSDFFVCEVGVRQGENLLPYLFSLYLKKNWTTIMFKVSIW